MTNLYALGAGEEIMRASVGDLRRAMGVDRAGTRPGRRDAAAFGVASAALLVVVVFPTVALGLLVIALSRS